MKLEGSKVGESLARATCDLASTKVKASEGFLVSYAGVQVEANARAIGIQGIVTAFVADERCSVGEMGFNEYGHWISFSQGF